MISIKLLLFLLAAPVIGHSATSSEEVVSYISSRHDQDTGGYRLANDDSPPTLAATNMAMRALRYTGIELQDVSAQLGFLHSRFDESEAAFVETEAEEPDVMANSMGLMLMAELRRPENRLAIAARDWLVEHAETEDEVYMAIAGMAAMGVARDFPATWLRDAMAIAEDEGITPYRRARAAITCMRCGLNLPGYETFIPLFSTALQEIQAKHRWKEPMGLQEAYTLARALYMVDGRIDLTPEICSVSILEEEPSIGTLYRHTILEAWRPKLSGELSVAICTGFAPVGYREDGGGIVGMDPELIRAFAEVHGYRIKLVEEVQFDGIWQLPSRGAIDLALSGISKRLDRLGPGVRWSYPYFEVDRSLSILKENADRFRTIADFGGMKIAVTTGTTGEQDVMARNPDAIPVPYSNEELAIADLLAGRVHALARGDVSNQWDSLAHPELAVIDIHPMQPPEEFVIAISRGRVAMGQKLDRFLREAGKSGLLQDMFKKYISP